MAIIRFALLLLLIVLFAIPAQSLEPIVNIANFDSLSSDEDCTNPVLQVDVNDNGSVDDEPDADGTQDYYYIVLYDGAGTAIAYEDVFAGSVQRELSDHRIDDEILAVPMARPFSIRFYDTTFTGIQPIEMIESGEPIYAIINIDPARIPGPHTCNLLPVTHPRGLNRVDSAPPPPDNRLNRDYGDAYATLYLGEDEAGNPAIDVYCHADSLVFFAFRITQADIAEQSSDTIELARNSRCPVLTTAYLLPTGDVEFSIGPDADGEVYAIVFTGIAPDTVRLLQRNDPLFETEGVEGTDWALIPGGLSASRASGTAPRPTAQPAPFETVPLGDRVTIANAGIVNIRVGPGRDYPIVGLARNGEVYALFAASPDRRWFLIQGHGVRGWINSAFTIMGG